MKRTLARQRGMTMLELLIVVVIVAAVSMTALPQLLEAREEYRLTAVSSELVGYAANARIMAVTRNDNIRLAALTSTSYAIQQQISGTWTALESNTLPSEFTIAATGTVTFQSRGNATPQVTFTITNPNGSTRDVVVETSGRAYAN